MLGCVENYCNKNSKLYILINNVRIPTNCLFIPKKGKREGVVS